ncbi:MAG: ribonuclease R, partial [Oribacterium sinus]|nr:ribonuclease R [Oribacterium sinus]
MREEQREKLKKIILDLIKDPSYHPMKEKELCFFLGVPKEEKAAFQELLMEMQEEGLIGISLQGKYSRAESFSQKGTFHANRRGFGFVSLSEKEEEVY